LSIPSQGNLPTPPGFQIQSAQGQTLLTWSQTPLAVIYYISRSPDGVTFTQLGTTSALGYADITAVTGTIYSYYVQSGDGTFSSAPTPTLQAQALLPGQTTVGNLNLSIRQRCDKVNSQYITDQEVTSYISESAKELYDILIQKFGNDYQIAIPYQFTLTGQVDPIYNAQVYPLPSDFYKLILPEVALNPNDPNSWVTIRQYNRIDQNFYNYPNTYTLFGSTNLRYRLTGNYIQLVPIGAAGQTVRLWYAPLPSQLINQTDLLSAYSGWEEYIVADCCIKILAKEESDVTIFGEQKAGLLKRIEEAAENRNISEPQTVSDSKARNSQGGYGSGGWGSSGNGGW
jgi:hypothetical protein